LVCFAVQKCANGKFEAQRSQPFAVYHVLLIKIPGCIKLCPAPWAGEKYAKFEQIRGYIKENFPQHSNLVSNPSLAHSSVICQVKNGHWWAV